MLPCLRTLGSYQAALHPLPDTSVGAFIAGSLGCGTQLPLKKHFRAFEGLVMLSPARLCGQCLGCAQVAFLGRNEGQG